MGEILLNTGNEVLRLPLYHCKMNVNELMWERYVGHTDQIFVEKMDPIVIINEDTLDSSDISIH